MEVVRSFLQILDPYYVLPFMFCSFVCITLYTLFNYGWKPIASNDQPVDEGRVNIANVNSSNCSLLLNGGQRLLSPTVAREIRGTRTIGLTVENGDVHRTVLPADGSFCAESSKVHLKHRSNDCQNTAKTYGYCESMVDFKEEAGRISTQNHDRIVFVSVRDSTAASNHASHLSSPEPTDDYRYSGVHSCRNFLSNLPRISDQQGDRGCSPSVKEGIATGDDMLESSHNIAVSNSFEAISNAGNASRDNPTNKPSQPRPSGNKTPQKSEQVRGIEDGQDGWTVRKSKRSRNRKKRKDTAPPAAEVTQLNEASERHQTLSGPSLSHQELFRSSDILFLQEDTLADQPNDNTVANQPPPTVTNRCSDSQRHKRPFCTPPRHHAICLNVTCKHVTQNGPSTNMAGKVSTASIGDVVFGFDTEESPPCALPHVGKVLPAVHLGTPDDTLTTLFSQDSTRHDHEDQRSGKVVPKLSKVHLGTLDGTLTTVTQKDSATHGHEDQKSNDVETDIAGAIDSTAVPLLDIPQTTNGHIFKTKCRATSDSAMPQKFASPKSKKPHGRRARSGSENVLAGEEAPTQAALHRCKKLTTSQSDSKTNKSEVHSTHPPLHPSQAGCKISESGGDCLSTNMPQLNASDVSKTQECNTPVLHNMDANLKEQAHPDDVVSSTHFEAKEVCLPETSVAYACAAGTVLAREDDVGGGDAASHVRSDSVDNHAALDVHAKPNSKSLFGKGVAEGCSETDNVAKANTDAKVPGLKCHKGRLSRSQSESFGVKSQKSTIENHSAVVVDARVSKSQSQNQMEKGDASMRLSVPDPLSKSEEDRVSCSSSTCATVGDPADSDSTALEIMISQQPDLDNANPVSSRLARQGGGKLQLPNESNSKLKLPHRWIKPSKTVSGKSVFATATLRKKPTDAHCVTGAGGVSRRRRTVSTDCDKQKSEPQVSADEYAAAIVDAVVKRRNSLGLFSASKTSVECSPTKSPHVPAKKRRATDCATQTTEDVPLQQEHTDGQTFTGCLDYYSNCAQAEPVVGHAACHIQGPMPMDSFETENEGTACVLSTADCSSESPYHCQQPQSPIAGLQQSPPFTTPYNGAPLSPSLLIPNCQDITWNRVFAYGPGAVSLEPNLVQRPIPNYWLSLMNNNIPTMPGGYYDRGGTGWYPSSPLPAHLENSYAPEPFFPYQQNAQDEEIFLKILKRIDELKAMHKSDPSIDSHAGRDDVSSSTEGPESYLAYGARILSPIRLSLSSDESDISCAEEEDGDEEETGGEDGEGHRKVITPECGVSELDQICVFVKDHPSKKLKSPKSRRHSAPENQVCSGDCQGAHKHIEASQEPDAQSTTHDTVCLRGSCEEASTSPTKCDGVSTREVGPAILPGSYLAKFQGKPVFASPASANDLSTATSRPVKTRNATTQCTASYAQTDLSLLTRKYHQCLCCCGSSSRHKQPTPSSSSLKRRDPRNPCVSEPAPRAPDNTVIDAVDLSDIVFLGDSELTGDLRQGLEKLNLGKMDLSLSKGKNCADSPRFSFKTINNWTGSDGCFCYEGSPVFYNDGKSSAITSPADSAFEEESNNQSSRSSQLEILTNECGQVVEQRPQAASATGRSQEEDASRVWNSGAYPKHSKKQDRKRLQDPRTQERSRRVQERPEPPEHQRSLLGYRSWNKCGRPAMVFGNSRWLIGDHKPH